ncbi:tetratricopeptide repeat protein [Terriglobus aquaticus]|uniref:Tetratricopeptide repeat protein n=1 Tax=Terriglobus aquaticus TaxID=940139 RepID=A0ABW9KJ72_9BACT|nr:tetratricopeptide repeat protein [Terriglobus aquaticus]
MTGPHRSTPIRIAALALAAISALPIAAQKQDPAPAASAGVATVPSNNGRSSAYYHYGLAQIYEDLATTQGRSDYATQAIEQYKLALSADPSSKMLQDGLAELYFKVGRIREAVQVAQDQVKQSPDDVEAHRLLGRIYFRSLGDVQNGQQSQMLTLATTEYETLVKLEPDSVENHLLLGQLYELAHNSSKAEAQFKAAQALDSGSEDSLLNLARLYSEQGDLQRVVTTLSAVPPEDRTSRMELALGGTYDQLHKPKEAAAAYQRAIDDDPDNLDARRGLASALLTDGQLDAAQDQLKQIVAAEPQDAQSYIRLSEVQRRKGSYDQALTTIKKAEALVPDSLELNYNEALIYDSLGRYSDAEQVLKTALAGPAKYDPNATDGDKTNRGLFLERLGNLYREQGRTADAAAVYEQMVQLGGDLRERGYSDEVDTYRDVHDYAKALQVAQAAATALPKDSDIQTLYAGQLLDTGKVDEAFAIANKQLTGKKEDRGVYLTIAQMYFRLKKYPEAIAAIEKAEVFSQKPDDKIYPLFLRGSIADKQNNIDEAEKDLKALLAIDPNNAAALNSLGYMYADRGVKLTEATAMLKKAVELDPQNYAYLDSLGWAYFKSGQYAMAETELQQAVDRNPNDPTLHDHLGQAMERNGKLKLAVAQWERAQTEYARSLPADIEQDDVTKLHKRLDTARVKLAKNSRETRLTP